MTKLLRIAPFVVLGLALASCIRPEAGSGSKAAHRMSEEDPVTMNGMGNMAMPAGTDGKSMPVPGHAVVQITPELSQQIGVTTGTVEDSPLRMQVRTIGIVRPNETRLAEVFLKTEGWVDKLFVNFTGQVVKADEPLLTIYSPEFLATQQEYLSARQAGQKSLSDATLRRLQLWDVPSSEIDELERTKQPRKDLTLRSPLSGTVLERFAYQGQRVTSGTKLYVIADLSTVWVQAKVYEYELPHVVVGERAHVTLSALPEEELSGKVTFVQPVVEEPTRTTQVRIELENPLGKLKPGMFAEVVIEHDMGSGLLVPASAVLRTGDRNLVYREEAKGRFVPVEVQVDPVRYEGRFHLLAGVKAGDLLVTSANFLIDSESRLRSGGGGMAGMPGMSGMDMGGMKDAERKQEQPDR